MEYRAAVPAVSCRVTAPAVAKQSDPGPAGSDEVAAGEFQAMCKFIKEARNSFFGPGVYLLKSKFRIEGKLRFP